MGKWNEQAAANNNLPSKTIRSSEMFLGEKAEHEFSEELSDGGERNQYIKNQTRKKKTVAICHCFFSLEYFTSKFI